MSKKIPKIILFKFNYTLNGIRRELLDNDVYSFIKKIVDDSLSDIESYQINDDLFVLNRVFDTIVSIFSYKSQKKGIEEMLTARQFIQLREGDCEDFARLSGLVCRYMFYEGDLVYLIQKDTNVSHFYFEVRIPKNNPTGFIPFDTSLGKGNFSKKMNGNVIMRISI